MFLSVHSWNPSLEKHKYWPRQAGQVPDTGKNTQTSFKAKTKRVPLDYFTCLFSASSMLEANLQLDPAALLHKLWGTQPWTLGLVAFCAVEAFVCGFIVCNGFLLACKYLIFVLGRGRHNIYIIINLL